MLDGEARRDSGEPRMPVMTASGRPWRVRLRHAGTVTAAWLSITTACASVSADAVELRPCRLKGVEHIAQCGHVPRPLDPQQPQGPSIEVHFAVLPAMARRKAADPVFFLAGGPGQSAMDLAGALSKRFARFGHRRDMVFVDQRGTGRSAPLKCADDETPSAIRSLAEDFDSARRLQRIRDCGQALRRLPHGDLRQYTTPIAMADLDAVRAALQADTVNLIGASYGSRAALDYMRQFPQRVRRAVLDGAVPPDMALPASFSLDNQSALEAVFADCDAQPACRERYPNLRTQWRQLLASLPLQVTVTQPLSGRRERLTLDRPTLLGAVRGPLYAPALAAALPAALSEAAQHRFDALLALGSALGGSGAGLASGMHFSVVCAEDMPRPGQVDVTPAIDFGDDFEVLYRQVCADWPRAVLPADFFRIAPASAATVVLSGGIDPATPPRHGERVALALGAKARHVVVPTAGHGILALACLRDAVVRFIDATDDVQALQTDMTCAKALPRPPVFVPVQSAAEGSR